MSAGWGEQTEPVQDTASGWGNVPEEKSVENVSQEVSQKSILKIPAVVNVPPAERQVVEALDPRKVIPPKRRISLGDYMSKRTSKTEENEHVAEKETAEKKLETLPEKNTDKPEPVAESSIVIDVRKYMHLNKKNGRLK